MRQKLEITHSEPAAVAVSRSPVHYPAQHLALNATNDNSPASNDNFQQVAHDPEPQSYGQYLFGSNFADPAADGDGQGHAANWSSYTGSRIMVRLFSRGVMGATFYTLAHRWIPGQLKGYQRDLPFDTTKPLQWLARGFDIGYGKPIQAAVKQYYKMSGKAEVAEQFAEQAVTFRPRRNFATEGEPKIFGRSLGAEVVGMSTDFAAGSVGDAWGRQIANMFDPSFRNSWEREDGSTDWKQFGKAVSKHAWQIISKNQGEDWAAALPYVYQMRYQRVGIDKLYRGFGMSSDHQLNGGSWRVNAADEIVGSYAKAGALDLQARFTGYNVYTLMYRDFYDKMAEVIHNRMDHKHTKTLKDPCFEGTGNALIDIPTHAARYVAKSAIKATIYMTPAVPFFWITRTPQTKAHGLSVKVLPDGTVPRDRVLGPDDPFAVKNTRGVFDRALNPFGQGCYKAAEGVNWVAKRLGVPEKYCKIGLGEGFARTFAEDWVNSSASYTPYMIAKAETALRWDRPKDAYGLNRMDRAIYRFLDGAMHLNLGEVKGGLSDVREELVRPPSNRQIQENTIKQSRNHQEEQEKPDTVVTEAKEQPATVQTVDALTKDASWKHKHMREQFMKEPFPEKGATIH